MTLPSSGPISLQDIANEFGGSHPLSMSNYYAGGPHVPSGATGTNGPVPTSGPLTLTNFYGTTATTPISVAAADAVNGDSAFADSATVTASTSAVVTGGVSPFAYLWAYVSGSTSISVNSATTQTPIFSAFITAGPQQTNTVSAVWNVRVTDSQSNTNNVNINVSLSFSNEKG